MRRGRLTVARLALFAASCIPASCFVEDEPRLTVEGNEPAPEGGANTAGSDFGAAAGSSGGVPSAAGTAGAADSAGAAGLDEIGDGGFGGFGGASPEAGGEPNTGASAGAGGASVLEEPTSSGTGGSAPTTAATGGRASTRGVQPARCPGTRCDGECVNTDFDPRHCGSCDHECAEGYVCDGSGACDLSCQSGLNECGGLCTNTQIDPAHCGGCGAACRADQLCRAGGCACAGDLGECDGACVDFHFDPRHCGACGVSCSPGEYCSNGNCAERCLGSTLCGERCADLEHDPDNCGECGEECEGESCTDGECGAGPVTEPRCTDVLSFGFNAKAPFAAQTTLPSCDVVDGVGKMVYRLPSCGDGPWAGCVFANAINLSAFDADQSSSGVLEVEFCVSTRVSGEINLWYGAFPTRKRIVLVATGETMDAGCRTVRRAPEEAVCHWTARPSWSGDCGGSPGPGLDKTCAACGSSCNQGCPITFSSARLTLIAEQCTLTQPDDVTIELKGVRFLPSDCVCVSDQDCAGAEQRSDCASGLFSSRVCPDGAPLCGVCVPPAPTCPSQGEPCVVELSGKTCPGTITCLGAISACQIANPSCAEG